MNKTQVLLLGKMLLAEIRLKKYIFGVFRTF